MSDCFRNQQNRRRIGAPGTYNVRADLPSGNSVHGDHFGGMLEVSGRDRVVVVNASCDFAIVLDLKMRMSLFRFRDSCLSRKLCPADQRQHFSVSVSP